MTSLYLQSHVGWILKVNTRIKMYVPIYNSLIIMEMIHFAILE